MGLNDKAWETLFVRHDILSHISRFGCFEIDADMIKVEREPRLMAKFDHHSNLPAVFRQHELSILPISRSKYVIGAFNTYQTITYQSHLKPIPVHLPSHITSIDPTNLYSESASLHCAYVSGMIDHLLGETALPTVSGRMSSKDFGFFIQTKHGLEHRIKIDNSQIEIDGGYETASQLLIVEAKKEKTQDFLIRQLYYPYRLWQDKLAKKVRPVFFTHSNDVFSFFVYQFADIEKYNSLELLYQQDYIITHESIQRDDMLQVLARTRVVQEPEIPFPQADSFVRIVDLLGLLMEADLSKDDITANYNFDSRQTNYYTTAAMYLELVNRFIDETGEVRFRLSSRGRQVLRKPYKQKYLSLVGCVLEHEVFQKVLHEVLASGRPLGKNRVVEMMRTCHLYQIHEESTYFRRAQTVIKWIEWILSLVDAE